MPTKLKLKVRSFESLVDALGLVNRLRQKKLNGKHIDPRLSCIRKGNPAWLVKWKGKR